MKEKSFKNIEHNKIHLNFPNGNWISTIWGVGSYTENNFVNIEHGSFMKLYQTFMESNDVEVMIECSEELKEKIHKKYDGDGSVIGHLNITQWLEIVNLISKEAK